MDKIDYKKVDRELYLPKNKPTIVTVPKMNFVAVKGIGDPNTKDGDYQRSMEILYGISYTIKMSKMNNDIPYGYHDYVVPPLEGFWDIGLDQVTENGIADKSRFEWVSLIRLPDYVTEEVFEIAKEKLKMKKPTIDYSKTSYLVIEEGLCAQIMHIGPYDDEPRTMKILSNYIAENGYSEDYDPANYRYHHEIYISDPRKNNPEKLKTVIRHPIVKRK